MASVIPRQEDVCALLNKCMDDTCNKLHVKKLGECRFGLNCKRPKDCIHWGPGHTNESMPSIALSTLEKLRADRKAKLGAAGSLVESRSEVSSTASSASTDDEEVPLGWLEAYIEGWLEKRGGSAHIDPGRLAALFERVVKHLTQGEFDGKAQAQ